MCEGSIERRRKPEGKRTLGRPEHRWEDDIERDLTEVALGGIDWD
jgi:hypothetical protein